MEILIVFLLILLNGVFSMSEIAMVSSRKARLEGAAKRGDKAAKKALELAEHPGKFLSTVQIGITLIGILTGIYSGEKIQDDFVAYLNTIAALKPYSETIATAVIVVVLTFFSLVLGELVPKRIGLTMPERISKALAYPMYWISVITAPFIWLLTITSDVIIKVFGIKPSEESKVTEEEIKAIVQEGTEGGAIEEIEQDIVERVFSLGDRTVASLMTHRSSVVFLRDGYTATDVRRVVNSEMHSAYPVLQNDSDNVAGVVLLKDLFKHINHNDFNITKYALKPQYFTEGATAYEALKQFKASKVHQAIVVNEFGEMEGLVTMNDLLEALVGDVSEFYDTEFVFTQREDGSWLIDGQYPLPELFRRFELEYLIEEYPFNTLSGLVLHLMRRVPKAGDKVTWQHFNIEIVDMDAARIDKVLLTLNK